MIYLVGLVIFFHGFLTMTYSILIGVVEVIFSCLLVEWYEKKKEE